MTDLTAITTPFGLLDAETQAALKAHGGPYEWYDGTCWHPMAYQPSWWFLRDIYRVTPTYVREVLE